MTRIPRIYADTSVIGGCLDIEFSHESLHFIEMVRKGKCVLLLSEITVAELDKAPAAVQNILLSLLEEAQVNLMNGYGILTIISPKEALIDED